ncbi:MAG: caspase family protein [Bacteroidales bacterium]|nr:caspase family protein [Bacteroidales bacterium]
MKKGSTRFSHLVMVAVMALISATPFTATAQVQSEADVNNEYRESILLYIKQDLLKKEKQITKQAERTLINLPNDQKLYDETEVKIHLDVAEGEREDGTPEYNLVYKITYDCKNIEGVTDDYPTGSYYWDKSNSCRAICNLTKSIVEGPCREYFQGNKPVTIRIFSTTDAINITHVPYNGEYGEFRYVPITFNGEQVRISISKAEGINNNAQLAFIRTQSIKQFIQNNISVLDNEENKYEFVTTNYDQEGGQYRRSSIELVVHGAFDKTAKEMIMKLSDDEYVDFNIPASEPGSNKNTFAVIFANEDYPSPLPAVPFAANDGNIMYKYCVNTLGIPERHVKLIHNASREQIREEAIQWVKDIAIAVNGDANILIYYAGQGTTDANLNPYIMPTDLDLSRIKSLNGKHVIGTDNIVLSGGETSKLLAQCVSIDSICTWFNKVAVKSITMFIDASFDGVQRNGSPLFSNKSNVTKIKALRIRNDILVFSSSEYNKTSYSYDDQHHGFFTYFILKELKKTKGDLTLRQLYDNVNTSLSYESSLQGKLQQPTVVAGGKLKDSWESQRLK